MPIDNRTNDAESGTYAKFSCGRPNFLGFSKSACFIPTWLNRAPNGYTSLSVKKTIGSYTQNGHRLVARLLIGTLSAGDSVLHRCGVHACCNPFHLYIGGTAENLRDERHHSAARQNIHAAQSPLANTNDGAYQPTHLPLSEEVSRLGEFAGFSPHECTLSPWLPPTVDNYVQLENTDVCGEVSGAHRLIYKLFLGPLDKYDVVKHSCSNTRCINPFHLVYAGKQANPREFDFRHDKRRTVSEETINLLTDGSKTNTEIAKISGNHPVTLGGYRRHGILRAPSDAKIAATALNRIKYLANFAGRPLSRG